MREICMYLWRGRTRSHHDTVPAAVGSAAVLAGKARMVQQHVTGCGRRGVTAGSPIGN